MATRMARYPAATGLGIARIAPSALGKHARMRKTMPAAIPTVRVPTPVSSVIDTLVEYVVFGIVPAHPDSRLPTPSAATAP